MHLLIIVALILPNTFCSGSAQNKSYSDCLEECGKSNTLRQVQEGQGVCYWDPVKKREVFDGPCMVKCQGIEQHPDQKKCWCEYCKSSPRYTEYFCIHAGPYTLQKIDDCDEYVCTGKALYKHGGCNGYTHTRYHSWPKKD